MRSPAPLHDKFAFVQKEKSPARPVRGLFIANDANDEMERHMRSHGLVGHIEGEAFYIGYRHQMLKTSAMKEPNIPITRMYKEYDCRNLMERESRQNNVKKNYKYYMIPRWILKSRIGLRHNVKVMTVMVSLVGQ